ncbi:MAG TPA: hypothetical protein V6D35_10560 [Candidatus Sericytochromatia bacterium]|jgi:hypothetical protein
MSVVELQLLPQKHQSPEKEHDRWFARLRSAIKNKPSCVVRERNNNLWKTGCCQGSDFSLRELEVEYLNLLTLCKPIIGFSPELLLVGSPQRGRAVETGSCLRTVFSSLAVLHYTSLLVAQSGSPYQHLWFQFHNHFSE